MRYTDGKGAGTAESAAIAEVDSGPGPAAETSTELAVEPCEEAKEFSSAICLLSVFSILVCAFVFVQLDMKHFLPEQIEVIKKLVGALTFGL